MHMGVTYASWERVVCRQRHSCRTHILYWTYEIYVAQQDAGIMEAQEVAHEVAVVCIVLNVYAGIAVVELVVARFETRAVADVQPPASELR